MNGVLVIDKPKGPTSSDVVVTVRRALKGAKTGHTGTLDPMATGVLPICVGNATRIAQYLTDGNKSYDAVIRLGIETDTLDADGKVIAERAVPAIDAAQLEKVLAPFRGSFDQLPPMFSAIRKNGKRLYELARAGEEVEREARRVTVFSLLLRDFSANELTLSVTATKGFFVRSLASDIGQALGCGAHLVGLRRTQSGPFVLADAMKLDEVVPGAALEHRLISVERALEHIPAVTISASLSDKVLHGVQVEVRHPDELVRVVTDDGRLLALADVQRGKLVYRRVLARDE